MNDTILINAVNTLRIHFPIGCTVRCLDENGYFPSNLTYEVVDYTDVSYVKHVLHLVIKIVETDYKFVSPPELWVIENEGI